jgi:CPA2 family monovalent cation:H+ antiporter-2
LHTPTGHIAVGWLIVEDLFTVLVLVLLPVVFGAGAGGMAVALVWSLVKIGLLVVFVIFTGGRLLPWLLAQVAATRSRELFTLTVLVLALGIAVGAARLFGVSMALGAFLAGMVVGQSDFSSRAASEALAIRDAFAVLFFVSVGMLFNPAFLVQAPGLVFTTLAIILLGKPLAALTIMVLLRYPVRVGLAVALALAQIGEFSFILATLGRELKILPEQATSSLIVAAIVSISLNPILYRLIDSLEARARRFPRLWHWLRVPPRIESPGPPVSEPARNGQAIVVGYGPVGRTLVRMLQENEIEPTVIELNLDTVQRLREDGVRAVYGDATHLETLKEAGGRDASVIILTSAGMHGSEEAVRLVRELNPRIRVLARSSYLREIPALRRHGADVVFAGEGEVALAMNELILRGLGASGEQIDRERDRIREELFGSPLTIDNLLPPARHASADGEQVVEQLQPPESGRSTDNP